jgi:hypothetical protein
VGLAIAVAAATALPLFIWGPRDFVDDVLLFQLRQPLRLDAMSLPALVARLSAVRLPGALSLVGAAAALLWARRLPRPAGEHARAAAARATALVYFAFFLSAKQAFCNYYYFVGALLLCACALAPTSAAEARA